MAATVATELLMLGEYDPEAELHRATDAAISHAAAKLGQPVRSTWVSTADISASQLTQADGLWVAPGSPYRNLQSALDAIRVARQSYLPCLGTCGGFQHMVLEFARNVLGFCDAAHAEYDPYASRLFINELACSLVGRTMDLSLQAESRVAAAYGTLTAREQYYCNFGVNADFVAMLDSDCLKMVGSDSEGEARILEHRSHPFFVGTLFVPQISSRPGSPHPLVVAFLNAAVRCRDRKTQL